MARYFVLITILLSTQLANGKTPDPDCGLQNYNFESMRFAVQQLSLCYHETSTTQGKEYIAAILKTDGYFQVIVQKGKSHNARLKFKRNSNQEFVGLWHTHGKPGFHRSNFSKVDIAVAQQLKIPCYLTDPEGIIRRFDPDMKVNNNSVRVKGSLRKIRAGVSPGLVVGQI